MGRVNCVPKNHSTEAFNGRKRKKERYWPMRVGGPYDDQPGQMKSTEIFKCTGCGAETSSEAGWERDPRETQVPPRLSSAQ